MSLAAEARIIAKARALRATALTQARSLARAERLHELRGGHRPRTFDDRGLHPYSVEWGRVWALQELVGELAADAPTDPVALRRAAREDAIQAFKAELLADGEPCTCPQPARYGHAVTCPRGGS